MSLLRHDRDLGMTQREKDMEQQTAARRGEVELARKPGRRTATHVKRNETWRKVY